MRPAPTNTSCQQSPDPLGHWHRCRRSHRHLSQLLRPDLSSSWLRGPSSYIFCLTCSLQTRRSAVVLAPDTTGVAAGGPMLLSTLHSATTPEPGIKKKCGGMSRSIAELHLACFSQARVYGIQVGAVDQEEFAAGKLLRIAQATDVAAAAARS